MHNHTNILTHDFAFSVLEITSLCSITFIIGMCIEKLSCCRRRNAISVV